MRLQPPVYYSSTVRMSQDVDAAGLKILKGNSIAVGMGMMCRDP